ncbi:deaminase domain-containing protein [Pseudomonas sp. GT1P32]
METTEHSETMKYEGTLSDYNALLAYLKKPESSTADFEKTLIVPGAHSPLLQFSAQGRALLHPLLTAPGYRTHCLKSGNDPDTLELTVKDDEVIYEIFTTDKKQKSILPPPTQQKLEKDNNGNTVPVLIAPKWVSLMTAISQEAKKIGGIIRADGAVNLVQMTTYYGILPWHAGNADEHRITINALEEKRARHTLRLDSGLDIDLLNRAPTNEDRKILKALRQNNPAQLMTLDTLLTQLTNRDINDIVKQFLPTTETSLLTHLEKNTLPRTTTEQAQATPTVFLEKILRSAESVRLGNALLKGLKWYGGNPDEDTSPEIRIKLVSRAVRLWTGVSRDNKPEDIAGYPWHQRSNWGKSYQAIWAEFEQHLRDSKRASSVTESILLARLFQPEFPREFQVPDIPPDLPYRSSAVWVNFVHGVTLADAMEPDLIQRLSFQQLVELPLHQSMQATSQELGLIALARMPPTVEWAITNGVILERSDSDYSSEEKAQSIKALDEQIAALKKAIVQLDVSCPERKVIAEREIKNYFKDALQENREGKLVSPFGSSSPAFISDGRKLIEDFGDIDGGGVLQTPPLKDKVYSFLDVYISGALTPERNWFITMSDGRQKSPYRISINNDRTVKTTAPWLPVTVTQKPLPDAGQLFESAFDNYIKLSKNAYQTLLKSQFSSLPHDDRQGIERGEVKIYTLRKSTDEVEYDEETPDITLPLRLRMGFILKITYESNVAYYECLPRAGIIRKRTDFSSAMLNGVHQALQVEGPIYGEANIIEVIRGKRVPFDWEAHERGSPPREKATCTAIIDQFGKTFTTPSLSPDPEQTSHPAAAFSRASELAHYIANNFFFFDEALLKKAAKGETRIEHAAARPHWLDSAKRFIPFWGGISDLLSGDPKKRVWAIFGLIVDVVSFAYPLGKFVSGSMKLVSTAVRSGIRVALPEFGSLFQKLTVSLVQNAIPFYGLPTLGFRLIRGSIKVLYAALKSALRPAYKSIRTTVGRAGSHSFTDGFAHMDNPTQWRPLVEGDQLASFRGTHDVPVRNVAPAGTSDYRFVDPLSAQPYGPALRPHPSELSLGKSRYGTLERTHQHVTVELPENTHIRQVLEVDGRTTLFIDDVPYRLKGDTLHRADLIESSDSLKSIPCRPRRAPGADVCATRYVLRDPAPAPAAGTFDETKGWATWFGDSIYTPGAAGAPLTKVSLATHTTLDATMEFRKGIYGRVKISITEKGVTDTFHSGAVIADSVDGSKRYVFTRLDAGDFYVAELTKEQNLRDALVFKQASTLPAELRRELMVVYTGSVNANNMARIYGVGRVERALKAMEEIAIPIGGHTNPPDTLRLIKVDTSPGEAVLFDHSTRMIVRHSTDGAVTWSLSRTAPQSVRQTTAKQFNTLFQKPAFSYQSTSAGPKALHIDDTMKELQKLISKKTGRRPHAPRNIAFAEIKTKAGQHEVYVSVSGTHNDTRYLPLFARHPRAKEVKIGEMSYFNIDEGTRVAESSLSVSDSGKLRAIPHTIDNIETYTPALTQRPTSLDTESKLIGVIREKYPDPKALESITIATTMAPCDSCSVVMKQFGYDGNPEALNVIWK